MTRPDTTRVPRAGICATATVLASLVVGGLTACGSGSLPASERPVSSAAASGAQTFTGLLSGAPATRTIQLQAGEALRWWARPTGGKPTELVLAIATTMRADNGDYSNLRNEDFSEFFSDNADSASSGELDTYGTPLVETTYIVSAGYTTRLAFGPLLFSDFGRSQGEGLAKGNWVVFVAPQTGKYTLMIGGTGQFTSSYETHPAGTTKSQAPQFDSSHPTPTFTSSEWLDAVKRQVPFLYDPAGYPNDGFSWNGTDVSPAAHRSFVDSSLDSCARFLANPDDPDASFRQSSLIEADRLLCSRD